MRDAFSREGLAIKVERRLNGNSVIDVLSVLFIPRGVPAHIRSDNGPGANHAPTLKADHSGGDDHHWDD